MVSEKRILAARANGARSRGPKTPQGKARSSRNALRHGFLSARVAVDPESRSSFREVFDLLVARLSPGDDAELGLIQEMASASWRLRRAWAMETGLLQAGIQGCTDEVGISRLAVALGELASGPRLASLHRYETRHHLRYCRALRRLLLSRNSGVPNEPKKSFACNADPRPEPPLPPAPAALPPELRSCTHPPATHRREQDGITDESRSASPPPPVPRFRPSPRPSPRCSPASSPPGGDAGRNPWIIMSPPGATAARPPAHGPPHPGTRCAAKVHCSSRSASRWCTVPPASARRLLRFGPAGSAPVRCGTSAARSPRAAAAFRAFSCLPAPDPPSKPRNACKRL